MKISLKSLLIIFLAVIFAFIAWLMIIAFEYRYSWRMFPGEWQLEDVYSSECVSYKKGGEYKIVNTASGKTMMDGIEWLHASEAYHEDSLVLFSKENRRGYFDRYTGEVVIPTQYRHAWIFSEGLAAVVKDDKVGFIDRNGNVVIDFQFPYYRDIRLSMDFVFHNGYCNMRGENQLCGIIDRQGKWVLSPRYDEINNPIHGMRRFRAGEKYGLLDDSLQMAFPAEYDYMLLFPEHALVRKNYEYLRTVSYDGSILCPYLYDSVEPLYYNENPQDDDTAGQPTGFYSYSDGMGYGLMDAKGRRLTKPMYMNVEAIGKDLFRCTLQGRDAQVLVNGKGEIVDNETGE